MIPLSSIHPDVELRDYLKEKISVYDGHEYSYVKVYSDHEHPTNGLPDDFLVVYPNGSYGGLGTDIDFARGNLRIDLYCKMNDDGSIKSNRIDKLLAQFDSLVDKRATKNFFYQYDVNRFITPTTPNYTTGYSLTMLNLRWTTTQSFNK